MIRLAALALLAGCAAAPITGGKYGNEWHSAVVPTSQRVCLSIHLQDQDSVTRHCTQGAPLLPGAWVKGCHFGALRAIYATLPESPSDDEAMYILGHEVMHELYGQWHEPTRVTR